MENQDTIGMRCIRAWVKNHLQCFIWDVVTHPFSGWNGGVTKPLQNGMSRVRLLNSLSSATDNISWYHGNNQHFSNDVVHLQQWNETDVFRKNITKFCSRMSSWWRVIIDWGKPETYGEKGIGREIVCRSHSLSLQWRSMSFVASRLFVRQLVEAKYSCGRF